MMLLLHEGHGAARKFFTPSNSRSYDRVARYATFGRDSAWKRVIIEAVASRPSVLELACGTGILSSMLVSSGRSVVGIDLTFEYLRVLRRKLDLPLSQGTAELLPYRSESFDAVVSSYLAKYVDVGSVADECWRVLRPRGIAVFHDFTYPEKKVWRGLWNAYFMLLRLCGTLASDWKVVFEELNDVIRESSWEKRIQTTLRNRGFENIVCEKYTSGTAAIVFAEKP
ncbi:MAG: class I SAM-dependent methyltransferase [Nitrososphaera sp.]|nr:class I SAM-dependent methyltransferase [Nitrososphaera sp.]